MSSDDLSADGRSRLTDAAIECFAASGFDVSVRVIAERAGVTAGLIRHHFGSKDALRQHCDAEILGRYRALKRDAMAQSPLPLFGSVSSDAGNAVLIVYVVRVVREGGDPARHFIELFVQQAIAVSREAGMRGLMVPSRDEEARTRYLVAMSLGALSIQLALRPDIELSDFSAVLDEVMADTTLPVLEIFTEGVFTDRRYLDGYLQYISAGNMPERHE